MTSHCCKDMARAITSACDVHVDPFDCPDALVHHSRRFDEYGIIIHDGGHSTLAIRFCPWCGARLPSRRQEWFERLAALGFDDPFVQKIPAEFETDAWYPEADTAPRGES
jgi:hypothetical protein